MPGPRLVNGTFREFFDGFVELGIPTTGRLRTPRHAAAFLSPGPPGLPFLSGYRVTRIRADSIKRWFAAAKRRVERFCGKRFSLSSIARLLPLLTLFSLNLYLPPSLYSNLVSFPRDAPG